jgi:iron-sulfur cluster repair protein YtfE (RIC family)
VTTILEHLTEEHRKVEGLLGILADSEPGDEREQIATELEDALAIHMAVEETFVYPIVDRTLGGEKEQESETEHDETRAGLEKLRGLIGEADITAVVAELAAGLNHHIQEEENEVFPALTDNAAAELEALGDPEQLEQQVETADLNSRRSA